MVSARPKSITRTSEPYDEKEEWKRRGYSFKENDRRYRHPDTMWGGNEMEQIMRRRERYRWRYNNDETFRRSELERNKTPKRKASIRMYQAKSKYKKKWNSLGIEEKKRLLGLSDEK